jgi:predicted nucleic acid-binding protein
LGEGRVEVNVLLDTNVLVYHVAGDPAATKFLEETIARRSFCLSILSVIEFLGWHGHTDEEFVECKELIELATILPVSKEVADKAIELRRVKRIKLADAVIASKALVNNLSLVTKNIQDFKGIQDLQIIHPFR